MLPASKTPPTISPQRAKVLLYGPPKVGKSTLCANLDPDRTLMLACEPGLGALETFQVPINTWDEFRQVGQDLASTEHDFTTVVIDTVDQLFDRCSDDTMKKLGVAHASDLGYGKGWKAISQEWSMRVAKLASLGLGVWFVSHSKEVEINSRVGSLTKMVPTLPKTGRDFILGFVDFILYAEVQRTADGETRLLRTSASENYEAGGRVVLPDPLPLDAIALTEAMAQATTNGKVKA